jgi:parvulin-like peptidyl-prolyl isomerase
MWLLQFLILCCLLLHVPVFAADSPTADVPVQEITSAREQEMVSLKVPLFSPLFSSVTVASVNDELITLEDIKDAIGSMHADMKEGRKVRRRDYAALLDRLINVKLILQEAKNIGLDELPEMEEAVKGYEQKTLIELLQKQHVQDVKPDEKAAESVYREKVRQFKVKSVLFAKEQDAKEIESKIKSGNSFDELAAKAIADGVATGDTDGDYFKNKDLLPQVAQAAAAMNIGSISPILPVASGFALFKLEDVRYPDDPEAREKARMQVLYTQRIAALQEYNKTLAKKYVKLNRAVYNSINYDKSKLEILLKDKRPIAEIKGDKPVTVGDLTAALEKKLYHGAESTKVVKKMNEKKSEVLEEIFGKKVLKLEGQRLKIDQTALYKNKIKEFRDLLLFSTFVQRVVAPDIKLTPEELTRYYDSHITEFTVPEMIRIRPLAFTKKEYAESAREKLLKGTDFQWLRENADGRIDSNKKDVLSLGNEVLVVSDLPEDIRKAVEGARSDDARLYYPKGGFYYVLYIPEVIPSKPQAFDEVKESIVNKRYNEKLSKAVEEWSQKLKNASDVKVYATGFNN